MLGSEIAKKIRVYITELAVTKVRNITLHSFDNLQQIHKRRWTFIHFDAAYDRLEFRSASGIIVRNENREILASQAVIHSIIVDPFTAEAYARLQAIKLGIRLGVNKLTVLGDSKTVIKKCQSFFTDKSVIGAIITDIQSIKNRLQEIEFTFVPKAQNIYAHTIAKEALRRRESFYLEKEVPEVVRRTVGNLWPNPPD
ncbi:uncharacterized protein LOC105789469 [Gossypium raimondii]|uniref:uncharacterized protein LOC105789469 n=1 Tax=Gossypium raimondii TaxID=29730 RepID=UPI00063AE716|nr:uncharacterized protein LOC105789469 [Gossypium raimondii]